MKSMPGLSGPLQSRALRRVLQSVAGLLVLVFLGLAIYNLYPKMRDYRWVLDWRYVAAAFVLLLLRGPVVVYGWWAIMRTLGHPLPFPKAIRIGYHSALARYLPGQMWYAVSRVYLAEKEGAPRTITAISIGLETSLLVVGAGIVSALSLLVVRDFPVWTAAVVIALLLALVVRPEMLFGILNWGLVRIKRQPVHVKLTSLDMLKLLWPFTLNWLHYGVMSYMLTAALYPSLDWFQLPAVIGLFTLAWLVGFLAILVPQGFVIREGLVVVLLGLLGVPAPVAGAAAILSRAWTILGELIWASVSTRF